MPPSCPKAEEIAKQFVQHYYMTFDADRKSLANLYRDNSMLTFQDTQVLGASRIAEKLVEEKRVGQLLMGVLNLKNLPFEKIRHHTSNFNAQPGPTGNSLFILVSGVLAVDDESNPLSFTQAFQLCQDSAGQWFVFNDIFQLVVA
ncbi:hypothetical protein VTH06DRAFT_7077 [Thermothelomyces fergusii]